MLPEKRKGLVVAIICLILLILLVFSTFKISEYIKSKYVPKKDTDDRISSTYPDDYIFYGITVDLENVVRVYGITDKFFEKYISIRSFYKDQDNLVKSNHLFMYTDCVNELRYDSTSKEFYLYKYDEYYSNNLKVKLAKNYILFFDKDNNITARKYNETESKIILTNVSYNDVVIRGNVIYYSDINGVHKYKLNNDINETIIDYKDYEEKPSIKLVAINDNYIVYKNNNVLNFYSFKSNYSKTIDSIVEAIGINSNDISYLALTNDGFYFQLDNNDKTYSIKKYSLINNRLDEQEYITKYKVKSMQVLTKDIYYMNIIIDDKEESILFSIKIKDIVKKLDNKYTFITSFEGSNEN